MIIALLIVLSLALGIVLGSLRMSLVFRARVRAMWVELDRRESIEPLDNVTIAAVIKHWMGDGK